MNDAGMHEHGDDEAPPLIEGFIRMGGIINGTKAAQLGQGALVVLVLPVQGGRIRALPRNTRLDSRYIGNVVHAEYKAGAHIDHDLLRGADHRVERWLGLDGRACQLGTLNQLDNEDGDLDDGEQVDEDGYPPLLRANHSQFAEA